MNPLLTAFIKVNLSVALFYLFYKVLFDKDTFLKIRRIYLLTALIFSLILPFIDISSFFRAEVIAESIQNGTFTLPEFYVTPDSTYADNLWQKWIAVFYLMFTVFFLLKITLSFLSILQIKRKSESARFHHFEYLKVNKPVTPFSFIRNVYLNPELHSPREMIEILIHENTHIRQLHSLDILLAEIFSAVCWFNPFAWLIRKEVRDNLEYIADKEVITAGFDHKHYQYHLLKLSCENPGIAITNPFNISPLKKRIKMMNKTKTRKPALMKYLLVAPLTLGLIMTSNLEILASQAKKMMHSADKSTAYQNFNGIAEDENQQPQTQEKKQLKVENQTQVNIPAVVNVPPPPPVPESSKPEKISQDEVVFQVVEKMPTYPGGDTELFRYMSNSIKYPVEAAKKGIQGRVICQFVIEKDGSIQEISVVRSVDPELDAEAVRVIKAMPKWIPGMQKGKPVRVRYTIPINFKLGDEKKDVKAEQSVDPSKQPVYLVNGERLPEGKGIGDIKPETIEKVDVIKPENEIEKAKLISKYGPSGANGVVSITLKK